MTPSQNQLEPIEPREAIELFQEDRKGEVSDITRKHQGYRLERFAEWCDENDVDNLNTVGGRDIQEYKISRRRDGINNVTLKSQLDTLRVFLRFCEDIDAVENGVADTVQSPSLSYGENRREVYVSEREAKSILAYLSKYQYATLEHTLFRWLWESGCRMGAARAMDLDDVHIRAEYVELRHRPEKDTPLKNGERGERDVSIRTSMANLFEDYIDEYRHDREDEYGRDPLFATKGGRITKTYLRTLIYRVTRPCTYTDDCPHDRDPDNCDGLDNMTPYHCPDAKSPHPIRKGAITHYRKSDVPAKVVSDRMNVSEKVLEEHYDFRSEREKMEQRRGYLDNI